MRIEIITLFPNMFSALSEEGVIARAIKQQLCTLHFWNPRDYVADDYKKVDDKPYGGGAGMVMMYEPLNRCIVDMHQKVGKVPLYYLSPQGAVFNQAKANVLKEQSHFALLCGRYEGIDERIIERHVQGEISLGDFIVSGGELPAMCLIDACIRLLPTALGSPESALHESFSEPNCLEAPHYTRPQMIDGKGVPETLVSGDHQAIARWRSQQAHKATAKKRPDLINKSCNHKNPKSS